MEPLPDGSDGLSALPFDHSSLEASLAEALAAVEISGSGGTAIVDEPVRLVDETHDTDGFDVESALAAFDTRPRLDHAVAAPPAPVDDTPVDDAADGHATDGHATDGHATDEDDELDERGWGRPTSKRPTRPLNFAGQAEMRLPLNPFGAAAAKAHVAAQSPSAPDDNPAAAPPDGPAPITPRGPNLASLSPETAALLGAVQGRDGAAPGHGSGPTQVGSSADGGATDEARAVREPTPVTPRRNPFAPPSAVVTPPAPAVAAASRAAATVPTTT
ncbi:MAG: hypothetical protein ACYCUG_05820, partial [Acidimicrobiales bacterium]